MDISTALKLLQLSEDFNQSTIQIAQKEKLADLQAKQASAPTDALKQKFQTMMDQVNTAAEFLLSQSDPSPSSNTNSDTSKTMSDDSQNTDSNPNNLTSTASRSSLSQTKLADLPGMSLDDSAQVELQPGTKLQGRYEVKELIGQGGMGAVYRVYDDMRDEELAIKVLLPSLTKNERALERFLNEAKISSKLSHTNIVNVYDVQKDGDLYFLTMELLEGQDLRQIMDNQKAVGRPFEIEDVQEYVQGICEGLAHAHEFTVHRDIKPENIWVTEEGKIKLMDFGIAQLQSTSQRTQTGAAMGTAYYMAPEQLKGKSDIDGRADQYAVAVLMYELLTGEVPAGVIEPLNELRNEVPKSISDTVMKALASRPENRFENVQQMNQAVQSANGVAGNKQSSKKRKQSSNIGQVGTTMNFKPIIVVVLLILGVVGGVKLSSYLQEFSHHEKYIQLAMPNMINIPSGRFKMGFIKGEGKYYSRRNPDWVSINKFSLSETEITFAQWDACVEAGGCSHNPKDNGWGRGDRPVINVSYRDITLQFIPWLNRYSGKEFRLPTEGEWEYAARAGSDTDYSWGTNIGHNRANCSGCESQWGGKKTSPVKAFPSNNFGLYDMLGNVWEWTQNCWGNKDLKSNQAGCGNRVMRGGSWSDNKLNVRVTSRVSAGETNRGFRDGFRLAHDL